VLERLPLALSATALTIALLGATPIGEAARGLVIPRNSVGAPQLKLGAVSTPKLATGAVTTSKLKKNAVRTLKVLDGSLLAVDFAPNQLPAGPKGDKGDPGQPGLSGLQVVTRTVAAPANSYAGESASCPAGKRVIAGGGQTGGLVFIQSSSPNGSLTSWLTRWRNTSGVAQNVTTYAVCATVP
jgi:hypothetical protein